MFNKLMTIIVAIGLVLGLYGIVASSVDVRPDSILDQAGDKVSGALGGMKEWGEDLIERHTTPAVIIDWGDGIVRATGRGTLPTDAGSYPQAKLMAIGAAELDAQRILASTLKGLKVKSRRVTDRYALKDYTVEENVRAALRGAKTTDTRFLPDGNVEIDMEIHLEVAPKAKLKPEPVLSAQAEEPEAGPYPAHYYRPEEVYAPAPRGYTSIVVDARSIGFNKARHLKIQTASGVPVFPPEEPEVSEVEIPQVSYLREEAVVVDQGLGGENPLRIKALATAGRNGTQLVVADSDARFVAHLPEAEGLIRDGKFFVLVD